MVFCCFVARSKASTVAVISAHVRMRRPTPYWDPQTHRHVAKAAHFSSNAGSFGACSAASADRLHIHCTSLLHAKLIAPDKVTAIVTAWLELWGWWVLSSCGWLARQANARRTHERRTLPCLGTASKSQVRRTRATANLTPSLGHGGDGGGLDTQIVLWLM